MMNLKYNDQLHFILNQNQVHVNNDNQPNTLNNQFQKGMKQISSDKKMKTSSQLNKDQFSLKKENKKYIDEMSQEKYYLRLQKLLDKKDSEYNSDSSNFSKRVNTFNQDSKNCTTEFSNELSLKKNLYSNQYKANKIFSLKDLSNNQFMQDRSDQQFKNLKQLIDSQNQLNQNQQKLKNINQNHIHLENKQTKNDEYQLHNLINKVQLQTQPQLVKQNSEQVISHLKKQNHVSELEEFVNQKMNFGMFQKQRYQKDILNDRDNDIEILKQMKAFTYFENVQSTINFKERFQVGQVIGQGAYASVRIATDKQQQKQVAIKIYKKEKLMEGQRLKGIRRELSILLMLKDVENVGSIINLIETRNHINIIMEYCKGKDIYSCMKSKPYRRLNENQAKVIFYQMMEGLKQIHSIGVSHRDIKLENVIVDIKENDEITVKIIDFGFSTCQLNGQKNRIFCGTPSYMAPEIVNKVYYQGFQADVWASGVVLYVMTTGSFPFKVEGRTDQQLYDKITNVQIEYPCFISQELTQMMNKIFHCDPYQRPTCEQILEDPWLQEIHLTKQKNQNNHMQVKHQGSLIQMKSN